MIPFPSSTTGNHFLCQPPFGSSSKLSQIASENRLLSQILMSPTNATATWQELLQGTVRGTCSDVAFMTGLIATIRMRLLNLVNSVLSVRIFFRTPVGAVKQTGLISPNVRWSSTLAATTSSIIIATFRIPKSTISEIVAQSVLWKVPG